MREDIVIAKIRKNAASEIWVVAKGYAEKRTCDVREYFHPADSPEWLPTKKGVSIPLELLAQTIDAVEEMAGRKTVGQVCELPRGNKAKMRFAICEYQNHTYAEVRIYYNNGASDDDWKPGKGVTVPLAMLIPLVEALRLAEDATASC
ncbi:MAG: transcriptional coactivator p15/PC4 family protein [Acidobacteriia bacterium]|nr:transcriptional coactivator p15/PC4 family protein [Terriglobia bacterium]